MSGVSITVVYMKRGFTIVELAIIVAVISILATITILISAQYTKRSNDSQAKALAASVRSAAERYYNTNNEYPSAQTLYGSAPTCAGTPNYQNIYTKIDVATANSNATNIKLQPYAGANCTWDTKKVYYLTKTDADGTLARAYTFAGCTYTFPTADVGTDSFLVLYYSSEKSVWLAGRSTKGNVATSDTVACPFKSL